MTDEARERWFVRGPLWGVSAVAWIWMAAMVSHASGGVSPEQPTPGIMLGDWTVMLGAMMLPLLRAPISHVRHRSFSHRRVQAITLFLAGYGAVWVTVGLAVQLGLGHVLTSNVYIFTAVLVAWQCSPIKQLCLNRRHAHPELAAFGWAADRDTVLFGVSHGAWCLGSCWLLMLLPLLFIAWWHAAAMVAVTLLMAAEQLEQPLPPRWKIRAPIRGARIVLAQARIWVDSH